MRHRGSTVVVDALSTLFVVASVAAPTRSVSAQQAAFRGGVDLVNLGVTVADRKGDLVTDLTAEDFEIYEDGKKQTIRNFWAGPGCASRPAARRQQSMGPESLRRWPLSSSSTRS